MQDIGPELWILAERLAKKSPRGLQQELALRTQSQCTQFTGAAASTASSALGMLKKSVLFTVLSDRYQQVLAATAAEWPNLQATIVAALPEGLRPDQCRSYDGLHAALTAAVRQLGPMGPPVRRCLVQTLARAAVGRHDIVGSAAGLAEALAQHCLLPSAVPRAWWLHDHPQRFRPRGTKAGMIRDPPSLAFEFEDTKGLRMTRVVHLEEDLVPSTPLAALQRLAERLARSHGFLLPAAPPTHPVDGAADLSVPAAHILGLLTSLQRLMKYGRVDGGATAAAASSSAAAAHTGGGDDGGQSGTGNKADLTLLYRDPEAALRNVDLQDADDFVVKEFKSKMDEKFTANIIKPGDEGYVYDKRVAMKTTGASEWDDDD